ncbi:MAG: MvdC/MvdD family ATP grasp protein [Pseudomonadota bacterium]
MSANDQVLLLTHSGDYYTIDLVEAAVAKAGAQPIRIDTDRFPSESSLGVAFNRSGRQVVLEVNGHEINLASARAIWARRLWPGRFTAELDPRYAAHCQREARTAYMDMLGLLGSARWINPLDAGRTAESKLLQLEVAGEVGLSIPPTLISNSPSAVREFYRDVEGRMITKLLEPLSQTMDGSGTFLYTSDVSDDDMLAIDELRYAPQIFQAKIEKRSELRVIVVGEQTFVGAIDATESANGSVDWRRLTSVDGVEWREGELPKSVEHAARQLMTRLGLVFGALDFIVDHNGRHIFLELNQAGEWGWLERDLGLPIAEAIAACLLGDEGVS